MLEIDTKTEEREGITLDNIPAEVLSANHPIILKGLVKNWPVVEKGLLSLDAAVEYIQSFYNGKTVNTFFGEPEINGRFFYNESVDGFNFDRRRISLDEFFSEILQHKEDAVPPAFYAGSTTIDACLPGFRESNDIAFECFNPMASIWMGNPSKVAAHYDAPDNIACSVVGKRRFTFFPPEQVSNLYVGPIDFTPAGQAISLVDFEKPDFDRFPKFRDALKVAQVAELEPGDAVFIPSMWWHHVEAFSAFNVLVNYWWRDVPHYAGPAMNVLNHAILGLRGLPAKERQAWKALFDHYIFAYDDDVAKHIPATSRGILGPLEDDQARQLRAKLINSLNR